MSPFAPPLPVECILSWGEHLVFWTSTSISWSYCSYRAPSSVITKPNQGAGRGSERDQENEKEESKSEQNPSCEARDHTSMK